MYHLFLHEQVSAFGKNKNCNEKQNFLQQIFIPPKKLKKTVQAECQEFDKVWYIQS